MSQLQKIISIVLFLTAGCLADKIDNWKIKPLANDYVVVGRSPDPNKVFLYNPGIAVCPNGRIVACFTMTKDEAEDENSLKGSGDGRIYTSDDDGKTWDYRSNFPMTHIRPFIAGNKLYVLGHKDDLKIISSNDWGNTWSETSSLTQKQNWHGSATNVWYKDHFVYLVMERAVKGQMKDGWKVSELAPVLLRGDVNKDLTQKENWTFASELVFHDVIKDRSLNWFGIPFYNGFYPETKKHIRGKSGFHPIGWLEANVVQITDPKHYWYDPNGKTFHIFMRAHTGITNIGCVVKAVEQADGTIKTKLQLAPSGKKQVYIPLPGGQMKFSVVYDEQTKLYWMLGTQSTDSMTKAELLPNDRFCLGDNERRRMALHFSKNMIDWCFAGLVSVGPVEKASRHYAQMVIKGNDLLILSRSGDENAHDAHNGNLITFHRIKNFRRLVY